MPDPVEELLDQLAAEGDVPRLVLVMDAVDLADDGIERGVLSDPQVEIVHDLFEDQDAGEDEQALDVGLHGFDRPLGLLVLVDLAPVLEAKGGEEPHVLVLLADEVVEELGLELEAGGVDPLDHLEQQLADAVYVQAVEANALPARTRHDLALRQQL